MKLQKGNITVWCDDLRANVAFAKVLMDVFGRYSLEDTKPGQTILVETEDIAGEKIVYFVKEEVSH